MWEINSLVRYHNKNDMIIVTFLVCVVACIYDLKFRIIPDWITIPYIVLGLALSLARHGYFVLAVLIVGFLLCELLYRLQVFGGGDLKLLLGLGMVEGVKFGFWVFYFSLLASLPLFVFFMVKEKSRKVAVPYAVAILAGVIMAGYWRGDFVL